MLSRGRRRHDETGVVAVIVAITMSVVLVGFGAFAVDLGSAYTRASDVQDLADQFAMAGAAALPGTAAALNAVNEAQKQTCARQNLAGICADLTGAWMQDGKLANGEVRFYADQGQSGMFADLAAPFGTLDANDFLIKGTPQAAGIRVVLPPSRVEFGLASAIGFDGVDVSRSATARIGTPLGGGILPFALKQGDLDRGEFCATDTSVTGDPQPPSGNPSFWVPVENSDDLIPPNDPPGVPGDSGPQDVHLRFKPTITTPAIDNSTVVWHASNSAENGQVVTATRDKTTNIWTVTVPENPRNTSVWVWATGKFLIPFSPEWHSDFEAVNFTGNSSPDNDLCAQPTAQTRGTIKLARSDGKGLAANVRQGPTAKLYDTSTPLGLQILSNATDCLSVSPGPSTACLSQDLFTSWSNSVSNGLTNSSNGVPGRLSGNCGRGTVTTRGHTVDGAQLIQGTSTLLTRSNPTDLRTRILSAGVGAGDGAWAGTISSQAMRCPRLAVMPVIQPFSLAGVTGAQKIVKFVYVWIDEANSGSARGLNYLNNGKLASVRGYVIEPGLFPQLVAGSPVVGPYLGGGMPKQVVLVRNLSPPTP